MAVELLHITDMHLLEEAGDTFLGLPPRATFREVVEAAATRRWDLALLTGDLAQEPRPASYEGIRAEIGSVDAPCYWVPGNHDDVSTMTRVLQGAPFRADRAFSAGEWRIVLLDTAVPGHTHGALSADDLTFLKRALEAHPDTPTLVAMHHSPVPVGSAWLDPINLRQPEPFREIIDAHAQVQLVLFGHVHQAVEARWDDTALYGCPSTCFQFAPGSDEFALDDVDPGYRRVVLEPDGSFQTELRRVSVSHAPDLDTDGYAGE